MTAKAGDRCCFCGEKLVSNGERVFCASVEDDCACVGRIAPQEDLPAAIWRYRIVGAAILANLEDRRGIKHAFFKLKLDSPFVYHRLVWELGQAACEANDRIAPGRAA